MLNCPSPPSPAIACSAPPPRFSGGGERGGWPPRSKPAQDGEAAVQWALAEGKTLEIVGQGSKRGLGRAAQWDLSLDLSGLSGVTLYEPEELILPAQAGTQ